MDTDEGSGSPAEQHRRWTMTAKGAEYAKEQLEQRRKKLLKSMNQSSSEI